MESSKAAAEPRRVALSREERRNAILDAAESLFLEMGFERATLGAVVSRSGGSLATLYQEFGSKENLLRAVVDRMRDQSLVDLEALRGASLPPREILRKIAYRFHEFANSPRTLAFTRVVTMQSLADPEFGRTFHQDIRKHVIDRMAAAFARWTRSGLARIDDPLAAAELYFASIMCDSPLKAMLGLPPEKTSRKLIDWRLEPFLNHFAIAGEEDVKNSPVPDGR